MDNSTQAHIFLADQHGSSETAFSHSYHLFNGGTFVAEGREPFGALCLLNDETLRPEASLTLSVEQPTEVVLMPVQGGLEYAVEGETQFLEPGQVGVISLMPGMTYYLTNPYPDEWINFLQVWFANPVQAQPGSRQAEFDLSISNTLVPFLSNVPDQPQYIGLIGRFAGRAEGTYLIESVAPGGLKRVFVFVLQGVFEVANRLLHEKDGLALTYEQDDVLEFEALSNDAVLLIVTC